MVWRMLKQAVSVIVIAGAVMLVPEHSYADRDWSWGHGQFLRYDSLRSENARPEI